MEKTLRYLLMVVALMGVLSVSAQTPKYGNTYKPYNQQMYGVYVNPQIPAATMSSTSSELMTTGSSLPQAALTGTTTADETVGGRPGRIRRDVGGEEDDWGDETEPTDPGEPNPLGDAAWPLMLLACMYVLIRYVRARKRA